jgi:MoaA/NifB/PqqE/SkfB family radical SAM enzyme
MHATAILSMLHEPAGERNSAVRQFRERPVLWWTLERLQRAASIDNTAILCWEDQLPEVRQIAGEQEAYVLAKGPRCAVPTMDGVTAARRWADGWRGGLMQTCEFDRGFHGPWLMELAPRLSADTMMLVDPSAGLVDPELIDALARHAEMNADAPLIFSQAAPGLSGVLLRFDLLKQLAAIKAHPGKFIHYQPQQPCRDPIGERSCAAVPTPVARSLQRFTLDSQRQIERIERATLHLNGELIGTGAEGLVQVMNGSEPADHLPREVVLELTTRRATRPVFMPAGHLAMGREDLSLEMATDLFEQLAESDDVRLTFGGVGDALLAPRFFQIVDAARDAGICAIHARTDLLDVTPEFIDRLAAAPVDVVSIQIPAISATTYHNVMGIDGLARVLENVKTFVEKRWTCGHAIPILVPVFTKCRENLAEMEVWYDKWLAALGSAVIAGANDYAGQIPDHAVADMSPPARRACGRLASRMHVLSDGKIVSCEQDVLGRQRLGDLTTDRVADVWAQRFGAMRSDHRRGEWSKHSLCGRCREWHRP